MRKLFPLFVFLFLSFQVSAFAQATLECDSFKYQIGSDGKNVSFIDKKSGKDYFAHTPNSFCAIVVKDKKPVNVSKVTADGGKILMEFAETGITAALKSTVKGKYILLEVESVKGGEIESFIFVNVPLTLQGLPSEPFGACALSLNLFTHVEQLPALQTALWAACEPKFGVVGAKVALIGVPQEDVLSTFRQVLSTDAGDMPYSTVAGPWAQDVPYNHGSYLFNFGDLTDKTVDDWVKMAKSGGFNQIDNHGGSPSFFKFGSFELNKEKFPNGWADYKEIVAKLHKEGIGSIFHTYSFFIDKHSKYVTPVPSQYLDSFRIFTLAAPISEDATEIEVNESTKDMNTITGFFVFNSIVLHIGDELVTFAGVTKEPPYKFTGCKRGALDTKAAAHDKDAKARHLKECFGLFVPDVDTPLFAEIAKNHADVINECDFDGIYLDAIDGCSILRGGPDCWYYGDKFIFEIAKNLKKPVGMEMSAMWHHCWQFRARWQAWDYPNRGQKRFLDQHATAVDKGLLLPLHFGWWNFQVFDSPQIDPSFSDVTEYLACKLLGYDAGISLTGAIDRKSLSTVPAYQQSIAILKKYQDLRSSNTVSESVKAKLREPGKEFTHFKDSQGKDRFKPAFYNVHKVVGVKHPSSTWQTENSFGKQPVKLRIEALMSVAPYDSPDAITIADFSKPDVFDQERKAADGLTFDFTTTTKQVKAGGTGGILSVKNDGKTPRNASWTRLDKKFPSILDLSKNQAFGVWVYGDGQGELLGFRLDSPNYIAYGALGDRYLDIDFKGWRYCELVETESSRWGDYSWQDGKGGYNIYRETIDFSKIESFGLWMNNVPEGKDVRCMLSPIKALPMVKTTLRNPSVTIDGKTVVFPVEMTSGSYIEFFSPDDCKLYGPNGELISTVKPRGPVPVLAPGKNKVTFTCTGQEGFTPRANVTVIGYGEPL